MTIHRKGTYVDRVLEQHCDTVHASLDTFDISERALRHILEQERQMRARFAEIVNIFEHNYLDAGQRPVDLSDRVVDLGLAHVNLLSEKAQQPFVRYLFFISNAIHQHHNELLTRMYGSNYAWKR